MKVKAAEVNVSQRKSYESQNNDLLAKDNDFDSPTHARCSLIKLDAVSQMLVTT